ncbi:MAG TPA: TetR/AcrR family transcriptional regulator [Kribbellaceae bacterium]|nr:TetR/AcrR family transcriptional regulator [Kribbellaceae bacterium]
MATRLGTQERRASILAAAAELFAQVGYHRCRVSDVAARLGVTEPVVFQNFGSKSALYAAVLDDAAETLTTRLRRYLDEGHPVTELLDEILAPGHLNHLHSTGSPGALFADAISLTAEPDVEAAARRGMRKVAEALTAVLAHGQTTGEVSADVDPATAAWWVLSLMASHRFRRAVMPNQKRMEAGIATMARAALTGR